MFPLTSQVQAFHAGEIATEGAENEPPPDCDTLYAEFQPLVRRLVRRYGASLNLRDDLSAEIYTRFCEACGAFDPCHGVPLRPYLIRMVTQSVYNFLRARWDRQRREESLLPEWEKAMPAEPDFSPADPLDPHPWLDDATARLPAAIRELPERQGLVVYWRYFDELSFEQIAAKLQIRPVAARSLLQQGISSLRARLAQDR